MGCFIGRPTVCPFCNIHRDNVTDFKTSSYKDLVKNIRPLDVIFFRSSTKTSELIRMGESAALGHGEFSHVAVVLDSTTVPEGTPGVEPEKLYVFEATTGHIAKDVSKDSVFVGVQLRRLEDVLMEYSTSTVLKDGVAAWSRLKDNPLFSADAATKADAVKDKVKKYYELTIHKDYEFANAHHMLLTIMKHPLKHRTDNTYFCSELVAGVFQQAGLFPAELDCETIAPSEVLCNGMKVTPKFEEPVVISGL